MALNRAIDRVDHVQRAPRRAAVRDVPGLYVKRKELGAQPALLHASDAGAIRSWWSPTKIEIIIRHRRGDVVVSVDHDRASMNDQRSLPKRFIAC